jgi:hypothetical protein
MMQRERRCRVCDSVLELSLVERKGLPDPVLYCPECDKDKFPRENEINS